MDYLNYAIECVAGLTSAPANIVFRSTFVSHNIGMENNISLSCNAINKS